METSLIKTDLRNQLGLDTIEAVIRVKVYLKSDSVHSNNIRISMEMIFKFNADMYKQNMNITMVYQMLYIPFY